jgi:hypothetical protein
MSMQDARGITAPPPVELVTLSDKDLVALRTAEVACELLIQQDGDEGPNIAQARITLETITDTRSNGKTWWLDSTASLAGAYLYAVVSRALELSPGNLEFQALFDPLKKSHDELTAARVRDKRF